MKTEVVELAVERVAGDAENVGGLALIAVGPAATPR